MCLHHRPCLTLLRDPTVSADICPLVVDEAHCIYQWGTSFRTAWSEIGRLRSILPPGIPFLACSATMTPIVLADVRHRLEISVDRSYHLNLGNCRSNITPVIVRMSGAATNLSSLNFLVRDVRKGKPLPRLLIFFNTRELTQRATEHIRALIPEELRPQIDYMHGMRTKKGKECVMREFRERKINVLCSTDCAGMVRQINTFLFRHSCLTIIGDRYQ